MNKMPKKVHQESYREVVGAIKELQKKGHISTYGDGALGGIAPLLIGIYRIMIDNLPDDESEPDQKETHQ